MSHISEYEKQLNASCAFRTRLLHRKVRRELSNGYFIEVIWHYGFKQWSGEFFKDSPFKIPQTTGYVYSDSRREIPRLLRLAIAKSENPKIAEVHSRMGDTPVLPKSEIKAMRLGTYYGMGPSKMSVMLRGTTI